MKSFWNAKKYLQPNSDKYPAAAQETLNRGAPSSGPGIREDQKSYAIIYGASNKAGKLFAYYLMSKGFNLILIERDSEAINSLEDQLRKALPDKTPIIMKVVLNKFDQVSWF